MIRLKELRLEKGYKSQKDFAEALNISKSTYNYWENEKIEIDYTSLDKLASHFDVSIDYLLGRTDIRTNKPTSDTFDDNTVVAIGRGGKRVVYNISDEDADFIDAFLSKFDKKNS